MNDVVAKLKVQPSVVWVPEVAHKIFKLDAPGLCPVPPVFPDDAWGNLMPVPRFKARVVNKFILKSRNQSFEGIPHDKKLEVCFQAKGKKEDKQEVKPMLLVVMVVRVGGVESNSWSSSSCCFLNPHPGRALKQVYHMHLLHNTLDHHWKPILFLILGPLWKHHLTCFVLLEYFKISRILKSFVPGQKIVSAGTLNELEQLRPEKVTLRVYL